MAEQGTVTVLVVDDEATNLRVVQEMLERGCGFKTLAASDYDEALSVFDLSDGNITLLLADVSLPGKSGVELAKVLLRKKRDLKILFISGWAGAAALRSYFPVGTRHFLPKPFSYSDLVDRVKEILALNDYIAVSLID
jgi:CheY-like chemotaxis protein